MARDLPGYEGGRDAEMFVRLDAISADLTGVGGSLERAAGAIEELHRWMGEAHRSEQRKFDSFDEIYRRSILDTLDYVELLGVEVHKRARRAKLSVAYIELDLDVEEASDGVATTSEGFDGLLEEVNGAGRRL